MKHLVRILHFAPAAIATALLLCVAPVLCQEITVFTNQEGQFTLPSGQQGTVTQNGKPLAGATVTFAHAPERPRPADGGFVTPQGGYTHKVIFGPQGDFKPTTPMQLLNELNDPLFKTNISTGYFRTWAENDRLIGGICTNDAEGLEKVIESAPQLELIKTERLTREMFEAYEKTRQESLPSPPSPRMLEIEKTDWYGKLSEPQRRYVQWDEEMFAHAYDPKNYDVGDARDVFEKRWLDELAKPEPGYPGMQYTRYVEAIIGLATIKSGKALEPLVKIAAEKVVKDNAHRHYAVKALGMLGNPAAIPELIPLVYHFNMNTRWDAQISLVRLTGQNFGTDAEAWGEWYMANREKLGENLPDFDATRIDWIFGSSDSEFQRWSDPKFQEEFDRQQFGQ